MSHILFRKSLQKYFMATTALTVASMLSTTAAYADPGQYETPTGFNLQSGSVNNPVMSGANDRNMDIQQNSNRAVINWNTFNIGRDAKVTFNQTQGSNSVAINRVTNNTVNRSEIFGTLKANGKVMILDRNGVLFDQNATIDVGGIIASTGELDAANQQAFMDGNSFVLNNTDFNPNGRITNNATMSIKDSGLLAFVAPYVENNGTINAKLGKVTLAAGKKVTVDFAGDELIQLAVNEKLASALVDNAGTINAQGGTVTMTANAASSVVDTVVNMRGVVNARSFSAQNGKIVLSSKGGGKVVVDGTLDVSRGALEGGGTSAGTIQIEGKDVVLTSAAKLLANLVATQVPVYKVITTITGYTYTALNGTTYTAVSKAALLALFPDSGSFAVRAANALHRSAINAGFISLLGNITTTVAANSTSVTTSEIDHYDSVDGSGNGGSVNINASNKLSFNSGALIDLRAGAVSGNGGSASLIAGFAISYFGNVNAGAAHGTRGSLLIDPVVLIVSNAASGDIVNTGALNSTLSTTDVTLLASEQVKFLESADFSGSAGHLTLNAPRLSFLGDFTTRTGGSTFVGGTTIDLGGKLYRKGLDTLFFPIMLTEADLADTATTVNILGSGASIMQGQSLAQNGATINVAAGSYSELLNFEIYKSVSLYGTDATLTGSVLSPNATVKISADDVTLDGFKISGLTLNGITASGVDGLKVSNNTFTGFVAGSAVNFSGVTNSTLEKNNVTLALSGITVAGGDHISLLSNTILGALTDGINISGTDDLTLTGNIITGAGNDGIEISGATGLQMSLNAVIGAGQHGLNLNTVEDADLFLNAAGGTTGDALHIEHGKDVNIALNAFGLNTGHGIFASDLQGSNIGLNLIGGTGLDGIHIDGGKDVLIGANAILGAGNNGITVKDVNNATVILNAVVDAGNDGIYIDPTTGIATLNYITGAGGDGIHVDGSDGFTVAANYISGSAENGINITDSDSVLTTLNIVEDSGLNGISVSGSSKNLLILNHVDGTTLGDGVSVSGGSNNFVALNKIENSGDDGVQFETTTGAILGNDIDVTKTTGVRIHNSDNTVTALNDITNTGSDGVFISASTNSTVVANHVADTGRAGINIQGGTSNFIGLNHVDGTKEDGIILMNGQGTVIGNKVEDAGTNGIRIENNVGTLVTLNEVSRSGADGIVLSGGGLNAVALNHVQDASGNGIANYGSDLTGILGNHVEKTGKNGILVVDADGVLTAFNKVEEAGYDGIRVEGSKLNLVTLNKVSGAGGNGISLFNSSLSGIVGNKVEGSDANGILVSGSNGTLTALNDVRNSGIDGISIAGSSLNLVTLNHVDGTTDGHGISVAGGTLNKVAFNKVENAGVNGINLNNTSFASVLGNRVNDSAVDGIHVQDSSHNLITLNHVDGTTSGDGIEINGGSKNAVAFNKVENTAAHGINIKDTSSALIFSNKVLSAGDDGIHAEGTRNLDILFNHVDGSTNDGIDVTGSLASAGEGESEGGNQDLVQLLVEEQPNQEQPPAGEETERDGIRIIGNRVDDSGANGIKVADASDVKVKWNKVTDSGFDGITVSGSSDILIHRNRVDGVGTHGVSAYSTDGLVITKNTITGGKGAQNGINVYDSASASIGGNTIDNFYNGIRVDYSEGANIADNILSYVWNDGIQVYNSDGSKITGSQISFFGDDGIQVAYSDNIEISGNQIDGSGLYGSQEGEQQNLSTGIRIGDNEEGIAKVYFGFGDFSGGDNISITGNQIKNTGTGLSATAFNNGYINIAGNTFTDNTIGMHIGSGLIDLTGETNTFIGGRTAMLFERSMSIPFFYPFLREEGQEGGENEGPSVQYAELALVDDTLGTTVFTGQSQYYVDLRNGAFFAPGLPTIINGMDATYDGVHGGLMTADQLAAIEAMINDYDDDKTVGQIFAGFTLADLDDNQILKKILGNSYKSGKAGIVVRNTPFNPAGTGEGNGNRFFSIQDLANLEPAAGGDDSQNPSAAELANLEPAAGGNDGQCWSNVGGGGTVNIDLSDDENVQLNAKSNCGSDI